MFLKRRRNVDVFEVDFGQSFMNQLDLIKTIKIGLDLGIQGQAHMIFFTGFKLSQGLHPNLDYAVAVEVKACLQRPENAVISCTAKSAKFLRSIVIPAFAKPPIKRE